MEDSTGDLSENLKWKVRIPSVAVGSSVDIRGQCSLDRNIIIKTFCSCRISVIVSWSVGFPSRSRPKFCTRVSTRSSIGAVYDTPKGGLLCGKLFCLGSCCGTGQTEFLQPSINKTLDHFFCSTNSLTFLKAQQLKCIVKGWSRTFFTLTKCVFFFSPQSIMIHMWKPVFVPSNLQPQR